MKDPKELITTTNMKGIIQSNMGKIIYSELSIRNPKTGKVKTYHYDQQIRLYGDKHRKWLKETEGERYLNSKR